MFKLIGLCAVNAGRTSIYVSLVGRKWFQKYQRLLPLVSSSRQGKLSRHFVSLFFGNQTPQYVPMYNGIELEFVRDIRSGDYNLQRRVVTEPSNPRGQTKTHAGFCTSPIVH